MTSRLHVGKDHKNGAKHLTPPSVGDPVYTSTSQKKRYINIAGVESDISYQESQWPMFVLKELLDNAFDFFKVYYPEATVNERRTVVRIELDKTIRPRMLHIAVRNSNIDNVPIFQNIDAIFDYNNWVSTKRNQHRMTAGGLGDFLKRVLGMGYASWTGHNDTQKDSFEDKQWNYPVSLKFNRKACKVFINVINNGNDISTKIERPVIVDIDLDTDTEIEVVLPLVNWRDYNSTILLDNLKRYCKICSLIKRNVDFHFTKEIIE